MVSGEGQKPMWESSLRYARRRRRSNSSPKTSQATRTAWVGTSGEQTTASSHRRGKPLYVVKLSGLRDRGGGPIAAGGPARADDESFWSLDDYASHRYPVRAPPYRAIRISASTDAG